MFYLLTLHVVNCRHRNRLLCWTSKCKHVACQNKCRMVTSQCHQCYVHVNTFLQSDIKSGTFELQQSCLCSFSGSRSAMSFYLSELFWGSCLFDHSIHVSHTHAQLTERSAFLYCDPFRTNLIYKQLACHRTQIQPRDCKTSKNMGLQTPAERYCSYWSFF